jgi:hypothetical protein
MRNAPAVGTVARFAVLALVAFFGVGTVAPWSSASQRASRREVSGYYEGTAATSTHGDLSVSLNLRHDGKAFSGSMQTPLGEFPVAGGRFTTEGIEITVHSYDDEGTITATLDGGALTGSFAGFGATARLALKRTGPFRPPVEVRPSLALSADDWRSDLRLLARELPERHKSAFHRVTREQFEAAVAELDRSLPSLSGIEVVLGLSRLVAMIGDGHTGLGWGGLSPRLPIRLHWFGDELRVTHAAASARRALGARVVAIGGVPVRKLYERARAYIAQGESESFVLEQSASRLTYPALLRALGAAPDAARADLALEADGGRRFSLALRGTGPDEPATWLDARARVPLAERRPGEEVWFTYLRPQQTVYLNFSDYPRRPAFAAFARAFFAFLDAHDVRRVVMDLRANGGGDLTRGRDFIVSNFKKREARFPRGTLFVLVGRVTFSAGMSNAADLRNELKAVLVGEPTGGRPNAYTENRAFTLPKSGLTVGYSTQYYQLAPADTPGLIPDKRIETRWSDYRAGRDPVLAWALTAEIEKGE